MPDIPRIIFWNNSPWGAKLPVCPICSEYVALEHANTDENGQAIHEECYLLKVGLKAATMPSES